jgi:Protein of unknown function (DUF4232)
VAGGATLASVVMLAAACSSSSASTSAAASSPPGSTAPASSAPAASTTPSASGTTSPSPGAAGFWSGYSPCRSLGVKLGLSQHDPTVTYQVIDFTNRGAKTCVIYGYPGVSLAAGSPAVPVGLPAAHNTSAPPKVVTLVRGGVVNALLQISTNAPQGTCGPVPARHLIVYLPDAGSVTLPFTATACSKRSRIMQISAVSLGAGG